MLQLRLKVTKRKTELMYVPTVSHQPISQNTIIIQLKEAITPIQAKGEARHLIEQEKERSSLICLICIEP